VDDAPYRVNDRTLTLSLEFGDETYRYRIVVGGNELTLEPVIPKRAKREALANPARVQSGVTHGRSRVHPAYVEASRLLWVVLEHHCSFEACCCDSGRR
jgi:hypothetical protein